MDGPARVLKHAFLVETGTRVSCVFSKLYGRMPRGRHCLGDGEGLVGDSFARKHLLDGSLKLMIVLVLTAFVFVLLSRLN